MWERGVWALEPGAGLGEGVCGAAQPFVLAGWDVGGQEVLAANLAPGTWVPNAKLDLAPGCALNGSNRAG